MKHHIGFGDDIFLWHENMKMGHCYPNMVIGSFYNSAISLLALLSSIKYQGAWRPNNDRIRQSFWEAVKRRQEVA